MASNSSDDSSTSSSESDQFHPNSKWKEPLIDPRLTLYDLHRQPRSTSFFPKDMTLCIPLKTLNAEFICPICLGYMNKTSIVMECLHRFCHECIQKCLRVGKKECPSCRIHIPSRRSLRADPEFDAMLKCILGQLDEQLEEQETQEAQKALDRSKAFMETRKRALKGGKSSYSQSTTSSSTRAKKTRTSEVARVTPSVLRGTTTRAAVAATGASSRSHASITTAAAATATATATTGSAATTTGTTTTTAIGPIPKEENHTMRVEASPLVEFELRKHPQETRVRRLFKEWLRISGDAPVSLLKTFLSRKLSKSPASSFQILSRLGGKSIELNDEMKLREVRRFFCEPDQAMMVLHYRMRPFPA